MNETPSSRDIASLIANEVWAVEESHFQALLAFAQNPVSAARSRIPSPAELSQRSGAVAVMHLSGILVQRSGGLLSALFDTTSLEEFGRIFRAVVEDPNVKGIVTQCESIYVGAARA